MRELNIKRKLNSLLVASLVLISQGGFAQNSDRKPLKDIAESAIEVKGERYTFPRQYRTLHLDQDAMTNLLSNAPAESPQARISSPVIFEMPFPDGTSGNFRIYQVEVMSPELAAKFPEIHTYAGQGIDDPSATIRLDMTPLGFHAMVKSPKGNFFIDPYSANTTSDYILYNKRDLVRNTSFICGVTEASDYREIIPSNLYAEKTSGANLRTYRLALACTGEYAATKGGTASGAMAGMVTTMNRVDGVYETEVAIRMVMVANNNLLVYTNSATDPYTNNNGSTMLGQNVTNCNSVIGSANYDIGHVFSTGGGGIAGLGVVCGTSKANGVTGSSSPVGDAFDIDYVAHEMGHQFGGNHTFNSTTGSCGGGNRAASAAYEPGSGITIMAYAGICGTDDLAPHSIAYFHTKSFDEIVNYSTTGNGNTCAVTTASGNTAPQVTSMGANKSIPISTPFVLTGAATDANGDPLTYSWEQYDLGTAGAWNANLSSAPLFRPFEPTTSPSRTFPKLSDIINNTTTVGEILPNVARTMHFQLTARDNKTGGGGVMHPDSTVTITVINGGGAFAVTAPNTAVSWAGGSSQTVTWNVSGTTAAPISTANVQISLSTDGGNTFPTVILASTPNDGSEVITVPNSATTTARIKVEAVGNIFFDMSNVNFTITAGSSFSSITTSSIATTSYCAGASLNVSFTTNGSANAGNVFTAQLSNSAGSFASPVSIGSLTSTTAGTIACTIPAGTASGSGYRIRVVSSNPVVTGSDNGANLTISAQVGAAPAPQSGSSSWCANLPITFTVSAITNATTYNWSVTGGGIITNGQGTQQVVIAYPPGQPTTTSTVSVYGSNANCTGTTGSVSVLIFNSPNTPTASNVSGCAGTSINLSGSPAGGTYSVANPYTGPSTTYTYTLTTVDGCFATSAPATITVNPLPTVTANAVSGCAGTSINLSGTPAGGTWSVANPYTGPSTTYTHTFTNANGCTNTSAPATITVNPLPTVTANAVSGCAGTSINLSGTPAGGTWSVANPYTGPSTTYTHSFTDANGCSNTSSAATITVNPLPTVTADAVSGCAGTSINLSGSPAGGTWSVANPYTGPSTTYTHSFTDANGCSNTSSPASITVNPLPTVSFSGLAASYTVSSAAITLTGSPAGGTFSGPGISGNTFNPATAGVGGPYTITYSYTDVNGCSNSSSQSTTVTSSCTVPARPGSISTTGGAAKVCPGDTKTYSIAAIAGATSYAWTPPAGGSIVTGQGTRIVTITYTAGYTATDSLKVVAVNACGNSFPRGLNIVRNNPATPSVITGQNYGVCNQSGLTYSITNVAGMTYNWSFSTPNASIVTGQGTNAVTANYSSGYTVGTIGVTATNVCGTSMQRVLTVRATPPTATAITGTTSVCANQFGVPYSTAPLATATTYTWLVPTGARINDGTVTSTSSTLVTTATSVTVNFATTAGTVRVRGNNACGSGSYFSLAVAINCREALDQTSDDMNLNMYPVPVNGILNVAFESQNSNNFSVRLINMLGKEVIRTSGTSVSGSNETSIDLSDVHPGVYFIEVINGEHMKLEKLIIE